MDLQFTTAHVHSAWEVPVSLRFDYLYFGPGVCNTRLDPQILDLCSLLLRYIHLVSLVSRMTLYPLFHMSWITCISGIPLILPHLVDSARESAYLGPGARMFKEHLPPTFFMRSNSADLFGKVAVRSTFLSELLYSNVSRYTASHFYLVSAHKWCLLRRSVRIMGSSTFVYTSLSA